MYNTHLKSSLLNQPLQPTSNSFSRLGNFELIQTLGRGKSHKTKLARDIATKQKYAVKIFKSNMTPHFTATIDEEASIHTLLTHSHPNLLNLLQYIPNGNYIKKNGTVKKVYALVMEYTEEENLLEHLQYSGPLAEDTAKTYFTQLLNIVEHIHVHGIVHTNIRPETLNISPHSHLKMTDFSHARYLAADQEASNKNRPPRTMDYAAPELIVNKDAVGFHNDVFSCGVLLFTMVAGYPPFNQASTHDSYYSLIKRQQFSAFWKQHERRGNAFSKAFKDLVNGMLAPEVTERLTVSEAMMHPWFFESESSSAGSSQQIKGRNQEENVNQEVASNGRKLNDARIEESCKGVYAMQGIQISKP